MKERPILFSGPMVRAILDGTKTQTRRAFNTRWIEFFSLAERAGEVSDFLSTGVLQRYDPAYILPHCPYGGPEEKLWVREEHYKFGHWEPEPGVKTKGGRMKWRFVPDSEDVSFEAPETFRKGRHHKDPATPAWHKRLARFMPRRYSRITLEIFSVRVERLQDISESDAQAEGCLPESWGGEKPMTCYQQWGANEGPMPSLYSYKNAYRRLWESINGRGSWDANPWVWVVEFKREEVAK